MALVLILWDRYGTEAQHGDYKRPTNSQPVGAMGLSLKLGESSRGTRPYVTRFAQTLQGVNRGE